MITYSNYFQFTTRQKHSLRQSIPMENEQENEAAVEKKKTSSLIGQQVCNISTSSSACLRPWREFTRTHKQPSSQERKSMKTSYVAIYTGVGKRLNCVSEIRLENAP